MSSIITTLTEDSATTVIISHDAPTPTLFADLIAEYQYDAGGRRFEWPNRAETLMTKQQVLEFEQKLRKAAKQVVKGRTRA